MTSLKRGATAAGAGRLELGVRGALLNLGTCASAQCDTPLFFLVHMLGNSFSKNLRRALLYAHVVAVVGSAQELQVVILPLRHDAAADLRLQSAAGILANLDDIDFSRFRKLWSVLGNLAKIKQLLREPQAPDPADPTGYPGYYEVGRVSATEAILSFGPRLSQLEALRIHAAAAGGKARPPGGGRVRAARRR